MSTATLTASEAQRELEEALHRLVSGLRDPEAMRKASDRMDLMREELRQRVGIIEAANDLIRDARNQ